MRIVSVTLLLAALVATWPARAYVRTCMWNFNGSDITVRINKTTFEKYGIDGDIVVNEFARATAEWYSRVGLQNKLAISGTFTSATTPSNGEILVIASESTFGGRGSTTVNCGGPSSGATITFYVRNHMYSRGFTGDPTSHGSSYPNLSSGGVDDLYRIFVHELGHALGMDHPPAGTYSALAGAPSALELSHDDINGARTGTCTFGNTDSANNAIQCVNCTCTCAGACTCGTNGATYNCGYTKRTSTVLKGLVSNNDAASWTENATGDFVNPGDATNVEASHAFGFTAAGTPIYAIAYIDSGTSTDELWVKSGSGSSWPNDTYLSTQSETGPAVVWGGATSTTGYWVVAYQGRLADGAGVERVLYYQTATSPTGTWSSPIAVTLSGVTQTVTSRPMLAYAPIANKIILAWIEPGTGIVKTASGTPGSTVTWANADGLGQLSVLSGGVDCVRGFNPSPAADDCLFTYVYHHNVTNLASSRGWTDPGYGGSLKIGPPAIDVLDWTHFAMDSALKADTTNGGAALAMMAWRGATSPNYFYFSKKSTTSQLTAWPSGTAVTAQSGLVQGPSLAYSANGWAEWTAVYAR